MKITKSKLKEMIKEEIQQLNEAVGSYKSVFDYNAEDPTKACRSFEEIFYGDCGYSESGDNYGWNDDKNWLKAVAEMHKEMFKLVDEYVKTQNKSENFYKIQEKIFKKWRKTDGSKWGS